MVRKVWLYSIYFDTDHEYDTQTDRITIAYATFAYNVSSSKTVISQHKSIIKKTTSIYKG